MSPSPIREQVILAPFTSYKVGGPSRYFVEPQSIEEIQASWAWAKSKDLPVYFLGKGSNVLVSDQGFPGLVILLSSNFDRIEWYPPQSDGSVLVRAQAGALLASLTRESVRRSLAGLECLGGIPGTVGGAVAINAGAYGQEVCTAIEEVVSTLSQGNLITRNAETCNFAYRDSLFVYNGELVVEALFHLCPGNKEVLSSKMSDCLAQRKKTQPLQWPNAGSVFKRPAGMAPGALIEQCGCKGWLEGGAEVSSIHANFIINRGGATALNIWNLIQRVRDHVWGQTGILLEPEIRWLGPNAEP